LIKDEHLDFNFEKKKVYTKNSIKGFISLNFFSGYNQKSISEIIVIIRMERNTWASLNIFLLIKARFHQSEILSKKSSSDISFNYILHTRYVEPHLHFIILVVAHVCFEIGYFKRRNLTATCCL